MSAPPADDNTVIRPVSGAPARLQANHGRDEGMLDDDTVVLEPASRQAGQRVPAPQTPATPAPTVAPRLYRFRIGTHEPIALDVPAFIGRRPSAPRIGGGQRPRLVQVPSPRREVSATHLELRQEGTSVVATDLGSTNGTVVAMVGSPPVVLRQGESVVVFPGCVVDIGDGILVNILAAQEVLP